MIEKYARKEKPTAHGIHLIQVSVRVHVHVHRGFLLLLDGTMSCAMRQHYVDTTMLIYSCIELNIVAALIINTMFARPPLTMLFNVHKQRNLKPNRLSLNLWGETHFSDSMKRKQSSR